MKLVKKHPFRITGAVVLVAVIAAGFAVFSAGGSFAAGAPAPTVTVTCTHVNYRGDSVAAAVVSWSDATNLGFVDILTGGSNDVRLMTSQRSGTFVVYAQAIGPSVFARGSLYSKPDKGGNVTFLASGDTGVDDCDY